MLHIEAFMEEMHLKDQTILGFSSLNKRTRKNERNISWFSEFLSAWNLKIKILIEIYSTHVFYVVISLVFFDKDEEVPPSHTPLWTQTPPAFQVNHFSLVLVGWTQMETVKYYRAMLTFHLSCNRSLHARYNHHLLYLCFCLSLSLPLLVYISVAWIQTQLNKCHLISDLSFYSAVMNW